MLLGGPPVGGGVCGGALSIHISCRIGEDRSAAAAGEQKNKINNGISLPL